VQNKTEDISLSKKTKTCFKSIPNHISRRGRARLPRCPTRKIPKKIAKVHLKAPYPQIIQGIALVSIMLCFALVSVLWASSDVRITEELLDSIAHGQEISSAHLKDRLQNKSFCEAVVKSMESFYTWEDSVKDELIEKNLLTLDVEGSSICESFYPQFMTTAVSYRRHSLVQFMITKMELNLQIVVENAVTTKKSNGVFDTSGSLLVYALISFLESNPSILVNVYPLLEAFNDNVTVLQRITSLPFVKSQIKSNHYCELSYSLFSKDLKLPSHWLYGSNTSGLTFFIESIDDNDPCLELIYKKLLLLTISDNPDSALIQSITDIFPVFKQKGVEFSKIVLAESSANKINQLVNASDNLKAVIESVDTINEALIAVCIVVSFKAPLDGLQSFYDRLVKEDKTSMLLAKKLRLCGVYRFSLQFFSPSD
jgi:hypothetical protein